jgi:hypothetical protein
MFLSRLIGCTYKYACECRQRGARHVCEQRRWLHVIVGTRAVSMAQGAVVGARTAHALDGLLLVVALGVVAHRGAPERRLERRHGPARVVQVTCLREVADAQQALCQRRLAALRQRPREFFSARAQNGSVRPLPTCRACTKLLPTLLWRRMSWHGGCQYLLRRTHSAMLNKVNRKDEATYSGGAAHEHICAHVHILHMDACTHVPVSAVWAFRACG